ncbi:MAG: hypothetical protein PHG61_00155 [Candidatus Marinimicrobia bacterium]|nr:hypothetical protein [Candidatus Neomarinimicrobiota bacterium]
MRKVKEEELLGPELPKEKKKPAPPLRKPVPEKKEEGVVKTPPPKYKGEPVMSILPGRGIYYTDATGKIIPPEDWISAGTGVKPGPKAMTVAEIEAYRKVLAEKDKAAKEAFEAQKTAEKAERLRLVEETSTWVKDKSGKVWRILTKGKSLYNVVDREKHETTLPIKDVKVVPYPGPAETAAVPAKETKPAKAEIKIVEKELPPVAPPGAIKKAIFPPANDDEIQDYLFEEWDEEHPSASVRLLKSRLKKLLKAIDREKLEGVDELEEKIAEFEEIKGKGEDVQEERESMFTEVEDAGSYISFNPAL